jgi:pyrroloquinoline-quinone synthase|tara:strand:- start:707 stop:1411 length:705 start_codon:yes stop_codon:yes gene_type:complete
MSNKKPLPRNKFLALIKSEAKKRYPDKHPFNTLLYEGKLNKTQIHGWITNWFYYQNMIPLKDGAVISNCPLSDVRRLWISRILEYDGYSESEGAIQGWIKFAESTGMNKKSLYLDNYLPGVRIASDSLLNYVKTHSWFEGISTSLNQLFLSAAIDKRVYALSKHYGDFIDPNGLGYFMSLSAQARKDSQIAFNIVVKYADSYEMQLKAVDSVLFTEDILWSMFDSIHSVYVLKE